MFGKGLVFNMILALNCAVSLAETPPSGPEKIAISRSRYVIGIWTGMIPGLGIGHAVQGRWREEGWKFTVNDLAWLAIFNGFPPVDISLSKDTGRVLIYAFMATRIFQVYKAWTPSREKYRIVQNDGPLLFPWPEKGRAGLAIGMSF